MKNFEIECKFDANVSRAFARARRFVKSLHVPVQTQTLHIKDVYLDHIARDLTAQKIALRVRHVNQTWEVTFKTRTTLQNGKAVRHEETWPLKRVHTLAQALQMLEEKKRWKGLNVTQLKPQFEIINKRTIFVFNYQGADLEMALDQVAIVANGRTLKMKEIEVELKQGTSKQLDRFVQLFKRETKLDFMKISKVKTAEKFLNLFSNL